MSLASQIASASRRFCEIFAVYVAIALSSGSGLIADEKSTGPDFQRDIQPILAENCYYCHGFDAEHRQADLRLDVPGSVTQELVNRILSQDPDSVMPPKDSNRLLTDAQRQLLVDWVNAGATYKSHWAFSPVTAPQIPENSISLPDSEANWNRSEIDRFVLAKLLQNETSPSPRSSPEKWFRRASLDLLGMAPSPEDTDVFLNQVKQLGEPAYANAVDQLLSSPRYGERMAQEWLDIARYADTHGFNNDSERSMWRWRDWVIDAFNSNMPYDQFITKQIAGDLLPNATIEDHIATGFCRNHGINSEGGIIDEEYRVEYVVDRVRTLGTGILGLTLECARCHDHKFDPISQKDFFSFYAFFNQVDEIGEDGRDKNAFPLMLAPTKPQQTELASVQQRISLANAKLEAILKSHSTDAVLAMKQWNPLLSNPPENAVQPVENAVQPVAAPMATAGSVQIAETQFGSSIQLQNEQSTVEWELPAEANTPSKPWTFETWIRWDGQAMPLLSSQNLRPDRSSSEYGRGLGIEIDATGRVSVMLGARLPAYALNVRTENTLRPNEWMHLSVSFDGTGSASGVMVYIDNDLSSNEILADGFNRRDGVTNPLRVRVGCDHSPQTRWSKSSVAGLRWYTQVLTPEQWQERVDRLLADLLAKEWKDKETVPASIQASFTSAAMRSNHSSLATADYSAAWQELQQAKLDRHRLRQQIPTVMVMRDRPDPRPTHILHRGAYDAPSEQVEADVPNALGLPFPTDAPKNRLSLAQWLTNKENPLPSRVAVNRIWTQFFGTGLVKTGEDFGYQSEFPSHPELLDWLSAQFIQTGWDVQELQRRIVLSEAYRQDSKVTKEMLESDIDNRLLTRGPRSRLPAETLRDHILGVSGLLKHRLGGPSVYPVQPEDLYKGIVVDAPYDSTKWGVSSGDDLIRRSVYTFWKRTVPYPIFNVFDAPDREFCVARRSITNTPLQALVLLNEPTMLQAARELGRRMEAIHLASADAKIADSDDNPPPAAVDSQSQVEDRKAGLVYGFRACTGRHPTAPELSMLIATMDRIHSGFESAPEDAQNLMQPMVSDSTVETAVETAIETAVKSDTVRTASWTAMASVILNLDETISKN